MVTVALVFLIGRMVAGYRLNDDGFFKPINKEQ